MLNYMRKGIYYLNIQKNFVNIYFLYFLSFISIILTCSDTFVLPAYFTDFSLIFCLVLCMMSTCVEERGMTV